METAQLNGLTNFIWNIADDVLRDVYVRGRYRDVILPMTVLRRLDAVLEPTKQAVLEMKAALDKEGVTNQDDALRAAAGHPTAPPPRCLPVGGQIASGVLIAASDVRGISRTKDRVLKRHPLRLYLLAAICAT
jgi:HsdM N-terminal domain